MIRSFLFERRATEIRSFSHSFCKMPKKNSAVKGKDSDKLVPSGNKKGSVYNGLKNEIIIKIHAKPGAKESGITDVGEESVGIQIGAPPVDGEANKELIRYLSEILQLKKSELSLEKGSRSKEKTVIITGSSVSADDVLSKLKAISKQ
ncbi:UPF0235 protein C15orf40 like protein [Argiope bruennichi]|uniref:UPF0235 protein C15orf40 like protein n=1 Tax=Argiope bruennichi TaxID=94029 RepID=A0A8T0FTP5_ARGBR|nr:UPF0235 protein C15orf40 like protein [Argiope bruennichi]